MSCTLHINSNRDKETVFLNTNQNAETEIKVKTVTQRKFSFQDGEKQSLVPKKTGLTWQLATLFVTGEVLGGGVVAIGNALKNTGWTGIFIIGLGVISNMYVGRMFSELVSTVLMEKQSERVRNPYSTTIQHCLGKKCKMFASFLLNTYCICSTTIYLLISTELFSIILNELLPNLMPAKYEFRVLLVVFVVILIPITLLSSPKEFWGVALFSTLTTMAAGVILCILLWLDSPQDFLRKQEVSALSFFSGLGTMIFAFGGIPFFPNIQVDLKEPSKFSKSITVGYICIVLTYLPIAIMGYVTLGSNMNENIVMDLIKLKLVVHHGNYYIVYKSLVYLTIFLLSLHFVLAFNLLFNSSAQEMEEYLKTPRGFCWQRCIVRVSLVLLILTLAQVVPNFNIILSFAGGTLQVILSFQLPILSHLKIKDNVSWATKVVFAIIFITACVATIGTIYSTAVNIANV